LVVYIFIGENTRAIINYNRMSIFGKLATIPWRQFLLKTPEDSSECSSAKQLKRHPVCMATRSTKFCTFFGADCRLTHADLRHDDHQQTLQWNPYFLTEVLALFTASPRLSRQRWHLFHVLCPWSCRHADHAGQMGRDKIYPYSSFLNLSLVRTLVLVLIQVFPLVRWSSCAVSAMVGP
jgi:hypothetical protein